MRQTEQFREGFYVVVMIEEEGDMCGGGDNGQEEEGVDSGSEDNSTLIDALRGPREKSVRIMIAPTNVEVRGAVVAVLLFYALTCLLASALVSFQMPVEGKVVKRMKEANINRKTRERWNTALAKVSKKTGADDGHPEQKTFKSTAYLYPQRNFITAYMARLIY